MPATIKPSDWLPGVSADDTAHTITFTTGAASSDKTLPLLDDAKADPTDGDIRTIALAVMEALFQGQRTVSQAPEKMTLARAVRMADSQNQADLADVQVVYTVAITLKAGAEGFVVQPET